MPVCLPLSTASKKFLLLILHQRSLALTPSISSLTLCLGDSPFSIILRHTVALPVISVVLSTHQVIDEAVASLKAGARNSFETIFQGTEELVGGGGVFLLDVATEPIWTFEVFRAASFRAGKKVQVE